MFDIFKSTLEIPPLSTLRSPEPDEIEILLDYKRQIAERARCLAMPWPGMSLLSTRQQLIERLLVVHLYRAHRETFWQSAVTNLKLATVWVRESECWVIPYPESPEMKMFSHFPEEVKILYRSCDHLSWLPEGDFHYGYPCPVIGLPVGNPIVPSVKNPGLSNMYLYAVYFGALLQHEWLTIPGPGTSRTNIYHKCKNILCWNPAHLGYEEIHIDESESPSS